MTIATIISNIIFYNDVLDNYLDLKVLVTWYDDSGKTHTDYFVLSEESTTIEFIRESF